MKKILIVNNNLDMGGIQKSLINLLKEVHKEYDITLLLFSESGALLKDVPDGVKIITPRKKYRMLGLTKAELKKHPLLFILKFFLMKYTSLFSRRSAMKLLGLFQNKVRGYDVVISYSHLPHHNSFANGCGDFVLDKVICPNKICMIHCDYLNSGLMTERNNSEYLEFDKIACCSDSVKKRFIDATKIPENKVFTLRNFYDFEIIELAKENTFKYEKDFINLLTVARLSYEKGIDKAINALYESKRSDIKYYVIGDGPEKKTLNDMIKKYHMEEQVLLLGEQQNPYRYMLNADYLFVPSLHEAAPMVFDEANIMGLPIISTNTTSASEMIGENGTICSDFYMIEKVLENLEKNKKDTIRVVNNGIQREHFLHIVK